MPYAVVSKSNRKIAIRSALWGYLAIYRTRKAAEADCMPHQMVREVTIKILPATRRRAQSPSPTSATG